MRNKLYSRDFVRAQDVDNPTPDEIKQTNNLRAQLPKRLPGFSVDPGDPRLKRTNPKAGTLKKKKQQNPENPKIVIDMTRAPAGFTLQDLNKDPMDLDADL